MIRSQFIWIATLVVGTLGLPQQAQAGPLLDWLRGLVGANRPVQTAYMPAQGCESCTMTCQRTVVNYVPQTDYRTDWTQVPVTTYRPVTSADPVTGCTITCMRPCTTYEWRAQRVPVTTYRPVYSTQTVQRPITQTAMLPAQGYAVPSYGVPTSGCSSCSAAAGGVGGLLNPGTVVNPATGYPAMSQPVPGTYGPATQTYAPGTYGTYGQPTPADLAPRLDAGSVPSSGAYLD
ncbi:MAG: hypothetical protein KDA83_19775, partial [Planctomycetales bacterium]|nr:hypothetical protein [Planctomycetales bacterium]